MAWSIFSNPGGGVTPYSWATSFLRDANFPQTKANIQSMIAWMLLEGGGGKYNPLNTTLGMPGASNFNSIGVKNYSTYASGITATSDTLRSSYYSDIIHALGSGQGLGSNNYYRGLSTWSGGGYGSLAGTWNKAAQYMGGKGSIINNGGVSAQVGGNTGSGTDWAKYLEAPGLLAPGWTFIGHLIPVWKGASSIATSLASISHAIAEVAHLAELFDKFLFWLSQEGGIFRLIMYAAGFGMIGSGLYLFATGHMPLQDVPAVVPIPV